MLFTYSTTDKEEKKAEKTDYQKKRERGNIKLMRDLTIRQREKRREKNRANSKKFRERQRQQKINNLTNIHCHFQSKNPKPEKKRQEKPLSRQKKQANRKKRRDHQAVCRELKKVQGKEIELKKQVNALKKQVARQREKLETKNNPMPLKVARRMLKGCKVNKAVEKSLIAHIALKTQLAKAYKKFKTKKEKNYLTEMIAAEDSEVRKSRSLQHFQEFLVKKNKRNVQEIRKTKSKTIENAVKEFLESDESSRQAPGKKECLLQDKEQIQKRYLNASLREIHKRFMEETNIVISYSTFCKYKPINIKMPKVSMRDTCACIIHENLNLLVAECKKFGITDYHNSESLSFSQCCLKAKEACLARTCENCKDKGIVLKLDKIDPTQVKSFCQWKSKSEIRKSEKTGEMINVKLTLKESEEAPVQEICDLLRKQQKDFMGHLLRIRHQYRALKDLKQILAPEESIFHIDFAECFNCKYGIEVQSVHFGASRDQISLHTGVLYSHGRKPQCFCSISDSTSHKPTAIFAHLEPILSQHLKENPQVNTLHFKSDGPSTQYKNKTMFGLIATSIPKRFPQIKKITWNFSEKYHGKGAPDGVGALVKRLLDFLVACGLDINNFDIVWRQLKARLTSVLIFMVREADIARAENYCYKNTIAFPGTKKAHQVTWARRDERKLFFNSMSCFECKPGTICEHFKLGILTIDPYQASKLKVSIPLVRLGFKRPKNQAEVCEGDTVVADHQGLHKIGKNTCGGK